MHTPEIVGRSSSHFTRAVRIVALELGVPHTFRPVLDLKSTDPGNYADNPALKIPVWIDDRGPLFGSENIYAELVRVSGRRADVVLRGDVHDRLVQNVEETTVHAMNADVGLVVAKFLDPARPVADKLVRSLEGSLAYLDAHLDGALAALPAARSFSTLEVGLFCVLEHLPFREVADVSAFTRLAAFCDTWRRRESAIATAYRFDV